MHTYTEYFTEKNQVRIKHFFNPNIAECSNGVWAVDDPNNYYYATVVNRTPHKITMFKENKKGKIWELFTIEKDENPLRVTSETVEREIIPGLRTTQTVFGKCEDLPDEKYDVFYIVSAIVKQAHPERKDLLVVNETVRDEDGRIIGCKSFAL